MPSDQPPILDYRQFLITHLALVDRVVRFVVRRHRVPPADAEEFSSVVRFRLIDQDFAILRKFEGRSELSTYLTTVINRLFLDFRIARWGKWRPSAQALRLGAAATLLEQLLLRDGIGFNEAVNLLQINHEVILTHEQLRAIADQFPARVLRRLAGEDELARLATQVGVVDEGIEALEDRRLARRLEEVLSKALAAPSPRDQLIVKWRYLDALSVVQIAEVLRLETKPIHRRLDHLSRLLRCSLERAGIEARDVARLIGHPSFTLGRIFDRRDATARDLVSLP